MRTAICLYVRDEERDIAEWIAFHHVVGFETVILFDNLSRDRTSSIARQMGKLRDVRVIPWPWPFRYSQAGAYVACLKLFGRSFDWIAFVDSDEFVLPRNGLSIKEVLAPLKDAAAVALNYAFFGSSGIINYPNKLVIESFTHRAPDAFPPNAMVKSIVRPEGASYRSVHAFNVKGAYVDPTGRPVVWDKLGDRTVIYDTAIARVNHYFTRSRAHWEDKIARGYRAPVKRGEADFITYDRNELEDLEAAGLANSVRMELSSHQIFNI
jgi:glycosyltransferase involved in cell wall biosynthesis